MLEYGAKKHSTAWPDGSIGGQLVRLARGPNSVAANMGESGEVKRVRARVTAAEKGGHGLQKSFV